MTNRSASRARRARRSTGRSKQQAFPLRRLGTILIVGSVVAIVGGAGLGILLSDSIERITPTTTPIPPGETPPAIVAGTSPTTAPAVDATAPGTSSTAAPTAAPAQSTSTASTPAASPDTEDDVTATATPSPAAESETPTATPSPATGSPTAPASPSPIAEPAAPAFVWISDAPDTVTPGQPATVVAQTLPNARVSLVALYGTMRETAIQPATADGSGQVRFTWTVAESAPSGPGRLIMTAQVRDSVVTAERSFVVR